MRQVDDHELIPPNLVATVDRQDEQATMFANRLTKNMRARRVWAAREGLTCWRVYDRDIPELPFSVDWYDGRLHVSEWDRPHDRNEREHEKWVDRMLGAAAAALEVPERDVFLKTRRRQRGGSQYQRFGHAGAEYVVEERGLHFVVNLSDYLDTGLFLDHRETRRLVRSECKDARVLNLFGYTGSFSVYAAAGGAREVTTVDLSRRYLEWARRNFLENGFDPTAHKFLALDARRYLQFLSADRAGFDLVVLDPPTFSNSRALPDVLDVQRDHVELIQDALSALRVGGVLYFSTNFRRFRLDESAFDGADVVEVTARLAPKDFSQHRLHRCWRAVRQPRVQQTLPFGVRR